MTGEELASIREVHTLLADVEEHFGARLDGITEQVTRLRVTIAKWAGIAAVLLFLANFAGAYYLSRPGSSAPGPQGSAGAPGPQGQPGTPGASSGAAAPASQHVVVEPSASQQPDATVRLPGPAPATTTTTSAPQQGPCVSRRLVAVCP